MFGVNINNKIWKVPKVHVNKDEHTHVEFQYNQIEVLN